MFRGQVRLWAAMLCCCVSSAALAAPEFFGEPASDDVRYAAAWVLAAADNLGRPFVVVDKLDARVYVFESDGRLIGAAPALLGLTPGDHSIPDIARACGFGATETMYRAFQRTVRVSPAAYRRRFRPHAPSGDAAATA